MSDLEILKRLFREYTKQYIGKIFLSVFFSVLVAGSTSAIAYLLDPAIEKIFIEKNKQLMLLIPFTIVFFFSIKGLSLFLAKTILIRVAGEIMKKLQLQIMQSTLSSNIDVAKGKAYNIGSGIKLNVEELIKMLLKEMNSKIEIQYLDKNFPEIQNQYLDSSLISSDIGWSPKISIEEGLKKSIDLIKDKGFEIFFDTILSFGP